MAIARFYRRYRSNKTVTFNVTGTIWQYVVIRDTSTNDTWSALTFNTNGTGSFSVRANVSYEIAFTTDNTTPTWAALQATNQPAYGGADIAVGWEDPPPPPPSAPTELFKPAEMVQRGHSGRRAAAGIGPLLLTADTDVVASAEREGVRIARKYRCYRSDQVVTFSVGEAWRYVVIRDTSGNTTWGGLRLSERGRGSVNVRHGVGYEFAFTNAPFELAERSGLHDTDAPEYAGEDIAVGWEDPPPPPPGRPAELFESSEMVSRGGEHERFWPGEIEWRDAAVLPVGAPATAAATAVDETPSEAVAAVIPIHITTKRAPAAKKIKVPAAEVPVANPKARVGTARTTKVLAVAPKAQEKSKGGRPPSSRRGRYAPLGPSTMQPKGKTKAKRGAARRTRR